MRTCDWCDSNPLEVNIITVLFMQQCVHAFNGGNSKVFLFRCLINYNYYTVCEVWHHENICGTKNLCATLQKFMVTDDNTITHICHILPTTSRTPHTFNKIDGIKAICKQLHAVSVTQTHLAGLFTSHTVMLRYTANIVLVSNVHHVCIHLHYLSHMKLTATAVPTKTDNKLVNLCCPLLPYGYSNKASWARLG